MPNDDAVGKGGWGSENVSKSDDVILVRSLVTLQWPTVTLHTSPYLHQPHLALIRPLVKCNETSGWVVVATNFNLSSRQDFKLWGLSPWGPSLADACLTWPLPELHNYNVQNNINNKAQECIIRMFGELRQALFWMYSRVLVLSISYFLVRAGINPAP